MSKFNFHLNNYKEKKIKVLFKMTLPLSRIDYATVGVTSRRTTKIFPATEHRHTQKFAVADHDGILYVYGKLQFFYIQNKI